MVTVPSDDQRRFPPPDRRPNPYEKIRQAILSGELEPGQPLVEATLAEWCQVSRTPVREALTRLEQDGLIRRGDRGLVVRESSPEEILDIYETRIVLEATAARFAADRRNQNDLLLMRRMIPRMAALADADATTKAAINADFHRLVWRASHNGSLIDLLGRLSMHLGRYPATTLAYPGRWETSNREHEQLVDAIEARNGELAAELAGQHFTAARDIRLKLWETDLS
ncbi:GntR family transcriptional regulator [Jiangella muralis]|uniref:GntR family transcriptional regulator n=1 Tax=Jiangella muralis TaxID=702383 RepID=UPI00069D7B6B|nr:GntR family transcriptional regulator [Jiangella muralis]